MDSFLAITATLIPTNKASVILIDNIEQSFQNTETFTYLPFLQKHSHILNISFILTYSIILNNMNTYLNAYLNFLNKSYHKNFFADRGFEWFKAGT